jgi:hypothetical protein
MAIWRGCMAGRGWEFKANYLVVPALSRDDVEAEEPYTLNNACRSILPVPVFGNSSANLISRGYL